MDRRRLPRCGAEGLLMCECLRAGLGAGAAACSTDPACSASSDSSAILHMLPLLLPLCCGGLLHTSTSACSLSVSAWLGLVRSACRVAAVCDLLQRCEQCTNMICSSYSWGEGGFDAETLCLYTIIACVLGLVGANHHSSTRVHSCSRLRLVRTWLHGWPAHT